MENSKTYVRRLRYRPNSYVVSVPIQMVKKLGLGRDENMALTIRDGRIVMWSVERGLAYDDQDVPNQYDREIERMMREGIEEKKRYEEEKKKGYRGRTGDTGPAPWELPESQAPAESDPEPEHPSKKGKKKKTRLDSLRIPPADEVPTEPDPEPEHPSKKGKKKKTPLDMFRI